MADEKRSCKVGSARPPDQPGPARGLALTSIELACGLVLGEDSQEPRSGRPGEDDPREALLRAMRGPLASGPCFVSFSGGRDSSAVLAMAAAAARRYGLSDPIPITQRFPGVASTEETSWQELVVKHLGLREWEIVEVRDDLDLLGPIACGVLSRHGILWPPNTYFHQPMFARATGGALMTGFDGDGLFGTWRWARAQAVLHGRVRLGRQDVPRLLRSFTPPLVRRVLRRPRRTLYERVTPWLHPAAREEMLGLVRRHLAEEPRRWDRRVAYYRRSRYLRIAAHSLNAVGAASGVRVVHPLLDADFLASLACAGGAAGYGDRTTTMRALFGADLPEAIISRRSKAEFGRALWKAEARSFAKEWDGTGVDLERINPDRLREMWLTENPLFGSVVPLQHAWLASQRQ